MKKLFQTLFLILTVALLGACSQIDTGNIGVESTMGQVKKETLSPGVYFTLFKRVTEVSAKELPLTINDMRPQTSDKITLADMDVDVYVQIDPSHAPEIMTRWPGDITQEHNEDGARVGFGYVTRQAREVIYNVVSKHPSSTIHTERTSLSGEIVTSLQRELDEAVGKGWFFVRSVNVRNLVTDQALEAGIKATAQAQFKLQEEKNKLAVAEVEAERKRVEAKGEADATRIKAEAVSQRGGAEYVQLQAIAKWDGKLPTTNGGAVPFINLK